MSYLNNLTHNLSQMSQNLNPDQVLHSMGLRRETERAVLTDTVLPALAVFSAGILVGASIALLVTPKSGRELRDDLSRRAGELTDTVKEKIPALRNDNSEQASYAGNKSTQNQSL
jgi:hypothetical protein